MKYEKKQLIADYDALTQTATFIINELSEEGAKLITKEIDVLTYNSEQMKQDGGYFAIVEDIKNFYNATDKLMEIIG
mgnify:CR=1 FL=1